MSEGERTDTEAEIRAARLAKVDRLRQRGDDPYPADFPGRVDVVSVRDRFGELEAGAETGEVVRLGGRITGRRGFGKAMFLDLGDRSGRIQLHATADGTTGFDELSEELDLGDILGVDGEVFCSRRGELSVRLSEWTLLAKCLRPLPEKWHGLKDTEQRYRMRYLDLLSSEEARAVAIARSRAIAAIRRQLDDRGFLEVETPVLQPIYGGALSQPFTTHYNALDATFYLRIATELYLKRLIVGGLDRVYEIGKDFRNEGTSFKHSPEFTMIEWYQAYAGYRDGMELTEQLVAAAAEAAGSDADVAPPWPRRPLRDAITDGAGIDPMADRDPERLKSFMRERGVDESQDHTWAQCVDHLLSHFVEPEDHVADVPGRLPGRAVAVRQALAERPRAGRAVRGVLGRHGVRQRLQRDQRPARPAGEVRGVGRRPRRRRSGDAADGRGLPDGAGVRDAADLRRRPGHRPATDAGHGQPERARRDPVPGPARATRLMGKIFEGIDGKLAEWISRQRMFFVGTAPAGDGHVNVSPKGPIESLRILAPTRVAYLDVIGSGAETIAHLRENGRICMMLCAFDGPPRIVRLHGQGTVLLPADDGYAELYGGFAVPRSFAVDPGARSVITVEVDRVADSCGYGVPLMTYEGQRPQQVAWVERKLRQDGTAALDRYVAEKNARSIDGLPAIDPADAVRPVT